LVGSHGLIDKKVVAYSYDNSDEIMIVALLKMAFVSICGIRVDLLVLDIHGIVNVKFVVLFAEEQQPSW
jgi:phosphoribosylformylglycinamidine (FGAM) synthase-like enzyme